MEGAFVQSGLTALDEVVGGLRVGDNVVWQVENLDHYLLFARAMARQAGAEGRRLYYIRFAPHPPVLEDSPAHPTLAVAPGPGFDAFTRDVHSLIEQAGPGAYYIFDNLSALVTPWATDELLANFFQVTCPYLRELDTVAYFALTRGHHSYDAIARIRDTTQVLIDVYSTKGRVYLHPVKVFGRYSPQMYLPYLFSEGKLSPVFQSGEASAVSAGTRQHLLRQRGDSTAPWDSLYRRLLQYDPAEISAPERAPELIALKQEFARMLIGNHPDFNRLVDTYLTLDDLLNIRRRIIGSGRIGGKAAGMLVARRILRDEPGQFDFSQVLEEHDSFFLGSDVFFTFLVNNDLFRLRLRLTHSTQISPEEYSEVEQLFLRGKFPEEIMDQFQEVLDYFGQAPIIVRSSSLLEDSFGNSFAGKYRSEFLANQGGPEERQQAFLSALKLVYASSMNPDVLAYRRHRGLSDSDEQMAILIQRVSGTLYRHYFFPPLAGIAFSHNLYRWSDRIDPEMGIIRLVMGLGTRAVNRVGSDYPRMISISHPELRPETGGQIARYSQKKIDVLDLKRNSLGTESLREVVGDDYPELPLGFSIVEDGYVREAVGRLLNPARAALTWNNLVARTEFIPVMKELLAKLEAAYGYPLDTEFTAFVNSIGKVKINLLQCRPLRLPGAKGPIILPENIPAQDLLFRAHRTIFGGVVQNIRFLIFISPDSYADAAPEIKKSIGRAVGKLNQHPEMINNKFILMGPGRWGSSSLDLGVNVTYADINHAAVLVEVASESHGHAPEFSYGTHFFLDLVETQIIYLPVYPQDPEAQFNHKLIADAPNALAALLPEAVGLSDIVKVISAESIGLHHSFQVIANPQQRQAICFLDHRTV